MMCWLSTLNNEFKDGAFQASGTVSGRSCVYGDVDLSPTAHGVVSELHSLKLQQDIVHTYVTQSSCMGLMTQPRASEKAGRQKLVRLTTSKEKRIDYEFRRVKNVIR